jgi:hypothetical protein
VGEGVAEGLPRAVHDVDHGVLRLRAEHVPRDLAPTVKLK